MLVVVPRRETFRTTTFANQISIFLLMVLQFRRAPLFLIEYVMTCRTTMRLRTQPLIPMGMLAAVFAGIFVVHVRRAVRYGC